MAQNITNILYNDLDLINTLMHRWGNWLLSESSLPNLGFSKTTSFLKIPTTSTNFSSVNETVDNTSELIYLYLLKNDIFLEIAKISFIYCRDCSFLEKSQMLISQNYNLGNKPETIRKKYKELETNLMYYIKGIIHTLDKK